MAATASSKVSVFSWADEVEKEEEEAQAQLLQPQKPNPFGFARPREIVLEEKGIDWRQLDEQLQSSNLRKEKQLKENMPAATQSSNGQERFPARSGSLDQSTTTRVQNARDASHQMTPPAVYLNQQEQKIGSLVPPLRYPPRNVMGLMEEMRRSHCSDRLEGLQHLWQLELERGRENMNYQHMGRYFGVEELMIPSMENMRSECRRDYVGNRLSGPPAELLGNGRRVVPNWELQRAGFVASFDGWMGSAIKDSNLEDVNGRFGRKSHHNLNMERSGFRSFDGEMRSAIKDSNLEEINDGFGRRGHPKNMERAGFQGHFDGGARYAIKDNNWENINDGFGRRGHSNSKTEKVGFGGNYRAGVGRLAIKESEWENMERDSGRRNIGVEEMEGRVLCNLKTDRRDFGENYRNRRMASAENYRKRGMASAAGISHYHQRRRR
ncbi:uncharacterized protein LOC131231580 [Magnolia sinica]|uniref:uncharacterized protein LOC131231580 n=1 Tax=Magnolia sinica TaxID=86752 RepID=UPI002658923C|nr:uncharacterized protein LOC131231580 [Magnolia sinica]